MELGKVLGYYEIVLLEICRFPGSFLFFHDGKVLPKGGELVPNRENTLISLENIYFLCLVTSSPPFGEYPTIMEKQKRPRESTDLEEYVVLVPKNIVELQAVAKLSPSKIWKNPLRFPRNFYFFWEMQ